MHRRTDPACTHYRAPRGPLTRWLHNRARGRSCRVCFPQTITPASAEAWLSDLQAHLRASEPGGTPPGLTSCQPPAWSRRFFLRTI